MKRIGIVALVVAVLVGCTPSRYTVATPTELAEEIADIPGIIAVDHDGGSRLTATVAQTAGEATVRFAALNARLVATGGRWGGVVVFVREGGALDPETDLPAPAPWTLQVFPGDGDEVDARLETLIELEETPGVVSVGFDGDWPMVVLASVDTFTPVFRSLSRRSEFAEGGTYLLAGEQRLLVVHIPERMTARSVEAIIQIAVDYPQAEVEVQALPDPGGRWPQVFVARLTADELAAVDARLRDPVLADADPEGYPVPFFLSTLPGADGISEVAGTLGDVPA